MWKYASILFLLGIGLLQGQEQQQLDGWVIDDASNEALSDVHVVNKRSLKGSLSGKEGAFEIELRYGDTIVFSRMGYKYYYFVYQDSATALSEVVVALEERNYMLDEVSVFSYELTSNKPREMEVSKPERPTNREIRRDKPMEADISSPAEYLYNLLGSKPKQLRKLRELEKADAYRDKLYDSHNRKRVMELTGLSREELETFMYYCKYSRVRMQTMNDYEFLRSVKACYRKYLEQQETESFLEQWE